MYLPLKYGDFLLGGTLFWILVKRPPTARFQKTSAVDNSRIVFPTFLPLGPRVPPNVEHEQHGLPGITSVQNTWNGWFPNTNNMRLENPYFSIGNAVHIIHSWWNFRCHVSFGRVSPKHHPLFQLKCAKRWLNLPSIVTVRNMTKNSRM